MPKTGSSGCCLGVAILSGMVIFLACCLAGGLFLWLSNTPGNSFLAEPTAINTCASLLESIHEAPSGNRNIPTGQRYLLDVYQVNGDQISEPEKKKVPESLIPLQDDLAAQQLIWEYFTYIIPTEERVPLTEYRIFTDGSGDTNGYFEIQWKWQGSKESQTWALEMDLADYQDLKSVNNALIHEFGHMQTLNIAQMDIRTQPADCPFYADENQCSTENSYLNQFFSRFWAGNTYAEWQEIASQTDKAAVKSGLSAFFQAHPQDFVREYAATAPKEDLADSWTYFVMTSQPAGETIAEQKILFFYNYPEFIDLRSKIRTRICQYYHQPE